MADVSTQELQEQEIIPNPQKLQTPKEWIDKIVQQEQQRKNPRSLIEIAEFLATQADKTEELVELLNRIQFLKDNQTGKPLNQEEINKLKAALVRKSVENTNQQIGYSTRHKFKPTKVEDYLRKLKSLII